MRDRAFFLPKIHLLFPTLTDARQYQELNSLLLTEEIVCFMLSWQKEMPEC